MPLTPEQMEIRRQGVTGSQIAVLAGLSPWGSPIEVYQEKVSPPGTCARKPMTEDMLKGVLFEQPCLTLYAHRTGRAVASTGTIIHPTKPRVIATPDGVSMAADGSLDRPRESDGRIRWAEDDIVLEVKCSSWRSSRSWGEEGSDKIPAHYYPQVIWEMAVTGIRHAHVVAYFSDELHIFNVPWDQGIFDRLEHIADRFWAEHVVKRSPPRPDATKAYASYLADLFPSEVEPLAKVDAPDDELAGAIRLAREAEDSIRAASIRLEEAKNILKSRIGIQRGMEGEFGRITWAQNKDSKHVDWKAVAKDAGASEDTIGRHTTIKPGPRVFRARWSAE